MYDIYLECFNGTIRLIEDSVSCRWERLTSIIWWCRADSDVEAEQLCRDLVTGHCFRAWPVFAGQFAGTVLGEGSKHHVE